MLGADDRYDRPVRRDVKRSIVILLQDLFEPDLAWQVPNRGILFAKTDRDIQNPGKPSLGFFDRQGSRHRSYHTLDPKHDFSTLIGQLWRFVRQRNHAGDERQQRYRREGVPQ